MLTVVPPLPVQTLTILGGSGTPGGVAANVEYFNPATNSWQPAYLTGSHPWGFITGTNSWINYKMNTASDPGAGPTTNQTLWYLYRVRFTVPSDAVNPQMTFSVKADNFAQIAINGVTAGGSQQFINNTTMDNVIVGAADQVNADAVFSQNVHPGENTITLNVGDWGGLNGFNFRIDLSMQSSQPLEIVPPAPADTTPPVISAPADITAEATGPSGAAVTFAATAVDDVDGPVPVEAMPASGSTFALGVTPVGLGASDAAGNMAYASFNVTVHDTTPPTITPPANIVAEATSAAGASVSFTVPAAVDLVSGNVTVGATPASGSTFALGATTVGLSAADAAGNAAAASFSVTVRDTTPPTITPPANIVAEATSAAGASVSFTVPAAADLVSGSVTVGAAPASGSTFPLGTTTVALSTADAVGNAATGSFTVTVRDTTAPVIMAPANIVAEATSAAGASVTFSASATDAVGVTSLTYSIPSGSTFVIGTTTVALSAVDAAGNVGTASFTVTVQDTTAPVITPPANIVAEATSAAGASVTFSASATDAVGVTSLTYSIPSGSTFAIGTTTVALSAADAAGNVGTASFTVTVQDTTAPVITSLTPSQGTLWSPNHKMVPVSITANASDAVGVTSLKIISVTSNEPADDDGDGHTIGDIQITGDLTVNLRAERSGRGSGRIYTITVEAKDAAGNVSTSTTTVTVPHDQKDDHDGKGEKDDHKEDGKKDGKKGKGK